jgi:hypothetical protein
MEKAWRIFGALGWQNNIVCTRITWSKVTAKIGLVKGIERHFIINWKGLIRRR